MKGKKELSQVANVHQWRFNYSMHILPFFISFEILKVFCFMKGSTGRANIHRCFNFIKAVAE